MLQNFARQGQSKVAQTFRYASSWASVDPQNLTKQSPGRAENLGRMSSTMLQLATAAAPCRDATFNKFVDKLIS